MEDYRDIWSKFSYRFSWKSLELLTILILARLLMPREFAIAFLALSITYFFMGFITVDLFDKESKNIKEYYNTASVLFPLFGFILLGIISFLSLFLSQELGSAVRISSVVLMLKSLIATPEAFFKKRGRGNKVYSAYVLSQVVLTITSVALAISGFSYLAVLYGYIGFYLVMIVMLWKGFPFRLEPKLNFKIAANLITNLRKNFTNYLAEGFLKYGIMICGAYAFGIIIFSKIYISFLIGYFLFENLSVFLTNSLSEKFAEYKEEILRFNFARIVEYLSFIIIPASLVSFVAANELLKIVLGNAWAESSDFLRFILLAGLLKGIFETQTLLFKVKNKESIIARIRKAEAIFLFLSALALGQLFGTQGYLISIFLSAVLSSILFTTIASRVLSFSAAYIASEYVYLIISGLLTVLAGGIIKELFPINNLLSLIAFILISFLIFGVASFIFNKDSYRRMIRFWFFFRED